jgi:hypothetical protein
MIRHDFHGWTLRDAVQEIDRIVGDVRGKGSVKQAMLITGNGVIKHAIMEKLKEYKLNPEEQWGNTGVVQVVIE